MILSIDTSAAHCAAGLVSGGRLLAGLREEMGRGQAERLMPMIDEVFAASGMAKDDLTAIAVCTGPGNFTGIRIAVATARGLSLALGIPAVGVGAFDASAHGAQGPVTVVRSARAGQVILQRFVDGVAVSPPEQAAEAPADAVEARVNLIALAEIAARRLASGDDIPRPAPIYMRPPDAALPSEPPPKILDR